MLLRRLRLAEAEAAAASTVPGHPWTEAPTALAYDEGLIRQDAADVLLHQCPLNRRHIVGTAIVAGAGTVAVAVMVAALADHLGAVAAVLFEADAAAAAQQASDAHAAAAEAAMRTSGRK